MKGMKDAPEFMPAPPEDWYICNITSAEAKTSKPKPPETIGKPMIVATLEVADGDHTGYTMYDNLITDGGAKGAGMAKPKLRALGIDVDSDVEIADEEIAQKILGMTIRVRGVHEARQKLNKATGEYEDVLEGGKPVMRLVAREYAALETAPAQASTPAAPATPGATATPPFAGAAQTKPAPTGAPAEATQKKSPPAWARQAKAAQDAAGTK